jgi:hypothetical protein
MTDQLPPFTPSREMPSYNPATAPPLPSYPAWVLPLSAEGNLDEPRSHLHRHHGDTHHRFGRHGSAPFPRQTYAPTPWTALRARGLMLTQRDPVSLSR